MIRYGLLGPVAAWHDGRESDLGSPQQRVVFALLLLHRNTTVSTDRMADVLWPAGAPVNGVAVLRTYVARLRSGSLSPGTLLTHPGGYELHTRPGEVDADRLETLLDTARRQLEHSDPGAAEAGLTEALRLVRGPTLPELPDDHAAAAERARLDELRATLAEDLAQARLAQGEHEALVPALRAAVADEPLRERRWAQLMVALYRGGRQAEALDAYRAAYRALAELGLEPGPQLRRLERMVLRQDAGLATPPGRVRGVPRFRTSLVGREDELAALEDDVRAARLVSLVGPAGAGKTRLAAETASRVRAWLGSRVWWVDLGAVGPGRVVAATARALAVRQLPGRTPVDEIRARLGEGPCLLVLDNCEHVIEEAAALTAGVLEDESYIRILSTSREALRLGEERVHRLGGLTADAAARLFIERAETSVGDAAAVAEVVARLDGLPLAIELAAAKLRSVPVSELARALRQRLTVLGEGPRDAPVRQRTLEDAIAWSYDLLSATDQRVLRRLSVFSGSFDAATAEVVVEHGDEALPALARLVDASLVAADPPRYRLLMTIRSYLRDRLSEAGEQDRTQRRHRDAFLALAETVGRNMVDTGLGLWLPRGRLEQENFLAALGFSLDRGDADEALGLAAWLSLFWFRIGFVRDGRAWLERAMAMSGPESPYWPRALLGRAMLASGLGSADLWTVAEAAVAELEETGDLELLAIALSCRGRALLLAGRRSEARADLVRAHAVAETVESDEGMAFADQMLGDLTAAEGDLDAAGELLVRARDRYRRSRVTVDAGYTLIDLARVRLAQQRVEEARAAAEDAVADFRSREDPRGLAGALRCLGEAYAGLGEPLRARSALDESRSIAARWGGALWPSGQPDDPGREPGSGTGSGPMAGEQSGVTVGTKASDRL